MVAVRSQFSYHQLSLHLNPVKRQHLVNFNVYHHMFAHSNLNKAIVRVAEEELPAGVFAAALVR